ncbi:MAG: hypothetical protein MPN21_25220, partial [Thermoanaerobaculia bacterium]|nr:hypothetical protein [Thermoanaerobaculia bacterium]
IEANTACSKVRKILDTTPSGAMASEVEVDHLPIEESRLILVTAQSAAVADELLVEDSIHEIDVPAIRHTIAVHIQNDDVDRIAAQVAASAASATESRQQLVVELVSAPADDKEPRFVSTLGDLRS